MKNRKYKILKISLLSLLFPFALMAQSQKWQKELLDEVNNLRKTGCKCGKKYYPPAPALTWNKLLEQSANNHAADMNNNDYFSHTSQNGQSYAKRIEAAGYVWRACAENIAIGQRNGKEAFAGWRKSPSHCANMMNKSVKEMGAANEGNLWVQDFGAK
jgi:uncharacterized protein YkwD